MLNKTINEMYSNLDFINFIHSNFMKEVKDGSFPEKYKMREMPKQIFEALTLENSSEAKNILERQLIRDNIYLKYKFDIFEKPIVVFYEDTKTKKLKPFEKYDEAKSFSKSLLKEGINSMLILIMNREIECEIFKN